MASVVALLNTLAGPDAPEHPWSDPAVDPFAEARAAAGSLRAAGARVPAGAPAARQLRRLREVRDAALARARGRTREYEDLARPLLRRYSFTVDPRGGIERGDRGWDAFVVDALLALVSLPSGALRTCRNPECRWAFVDRSNSGRRVWCDMARCGNRAKVARFRRRQRGGGAASSGRSRGPAAVR